MRRMSPLATTLATLALLFASAAQAQVVNVKGAPYKGDPNAPLVLVEFADYQCGFCARSALQTMPKIQEQYVATGKIGYVFLDLPLEMHPQAFRAARAAHCAGDQGKYWEMHDQLFANSRDLSPQRLPELARGIGLDVAKFEACLASDEHTAGIRTDMAQAGRLSVYGTPNYMVGRYDPKTSKVTVLEKISGAQPFEQFQRVLDKLLSAPPAAEAAAGS